MLVLLALTTICTQFEAFPEFILCTQIAEPAEPLPDQEIARAATCVERADSETNLSESQGLALCSSGTSAAPIECFHAADRVTPLSDQQAMDLCRFADSTAPVDCFVSLDRETMLSDQQIFSLCAATLQPALQPR